MKGLIGAVLLIVFLGAASADAWPWSRKGGGSRGKLPKPIDHPVLRPKADDGHKIGYRKRHPSRYQRYGWGSELGRLTRNARTPKGVPYLYQE